MEIKTPEFSLKQLIYYIYEETVLPEMFDLLGEESMKKLILVFGGLKITIPTYKEIKDLKRNIDIYKTLSYSQSSETVQFLAEKYNVTTSWIHLIFKKMRREYSKILDSIEKVEQPEKVRITTKRKQNLKTHERTMNGAKSHQEKSHH